jgi:hypothetical protein
MSTILGILDNNNNLKSILVINHKKQQITCVAGNLYLPSMRETIDVLFQTGCHQKLINGINALGFEAERSICFWLDDCMPILNHISNVNINDCTSPQAQLILIKQLLSAKINFLPFLQEIFTYSIPSTIEHLKKVNANYELIAMDDAGK